MFRQSPLSLKPMVTLQSAPPPDYAALILAGGRGSRMGGADKGLVDWDGKSLVQAVLNRLRAQTMPPQAIWISANRHADEYAKLGTVAVVKDERPDFAGPLAGIESTLRSVSAPFLLVVPCDTPLLPVDLFESLYQAMQLDASLSATYAVTLADESILTPSMNKSSSTDAHPNVQVHPLCCLLRTALLADLSNYLDQDQSRVMGWMQRIHAKAVTFSASKAFANMNDLNTLAAMRSAP